MLELEALVSVGSIFLPPCLVLLAWLRWLSARRRGHPELAKRWALVTLAAVALTAWAWLSFGLPID